MEPTFEEIYTRGSRDIALDIIPLAEMVYSLEFGPEAWRQDDHARFKSHLARYQREIQGLKEELNDPTARPALEIIEDIRESIQSYQKALDTDPSRAGTVLEAIEITIPILEVFSEWK